MKRDSQLLGLYNISYGTEQGKDTCMFVQDIGVLRPIHIFTQTLSKKQTKMEKKYYEALHAEEESKGSKEYTRRWKLYIRVSWKTTPRSQ